jgi:hypothetical protein
MDVDKTGASDFQFRDQIAAFCARNNGCSNFPRILLCTLGRSHSAITLEMTKLWLGGTIDSSMGSVQALVFKC